MIRSCAIASLAVLSAAPVFAQLSNIGKHNAGAYECLVTNPCGEFVTNAATVTPCEADIDCDGFVNGLDYDTYVTLFENGDEAADFDGDGFVTGIDFDLYVIAFETGC